MTSRSEWLMVRPCRETSSDELRSLRTWLLGEAELRGRVGIVERSPDVGELGALPEALTIALGPGGVAAAVASALIAWVRHRTSDVVLRMTFANGTSVELDGRRLRRLSATDVSAQVVGLGQMLTEQSATAPDRP
jgi:Effector Associated Constant Component 1